MTLQTTKLAVAVLLQEDGLLLAKNGDGKYHLPSVEYTKGEDWFWGLVDQLKQLGWELHSTRSIGQPEGLRIVWVPYFTPHTPEGGVHQSVVTRDFDTIELDDVAKVVVKLLADKQML